ncbi:LysR family transcriptional regulator [Corynebacterium glyciniphilum]|uniref:LysR family transcriptional regulator n=1 Tax=Corynebacterium glyciniphilum TaxID=1404244 RepID=UPI00265664CF|nr:LysR family transcriptional regulator [Corynebacterium glyciniphilum]MDN6706966.1 LysR family transcriptional regulator [Corynebacterium glyciniphilum]
MAGRLTLESLRYADGVAGTGSIGSAARTLGVTQPALSASLSTLEQRLGARLFHRRPGGCVPTAFGELVLPRIRQVIAELDRMAGDVESFTSGHSRTVRVGVSPQIDKHLVVLLKGVVEGTGTPGRRELSLLESELSHLEGLLRDGELDMVLVPAVGALEDFSHRILDSDFLVLVEPTTDTTPVTVVDLAGRELIMCSHGCGLTDAAAQLFADTGHTMRRSPVEVTACGTLQSWADSGLGSVILPERNVAPGTPTRRIVHTHGDDIVAELFYEVIWDPGTSASGYLGSVAAVLGAAVKRPHNPHRGAS